MRMSQKLVFHKSKCICAIVRILSATAMYVSSSSFMYLRIPCYCDACLNSSALRVGVMTLLNTVSEVSYFLQILLQKNGRGGIRISVQTLVVTITATTVHCLKLKQGSGNGYACGS